MAFPSSRSRRPSSSRTPARRKTASRPGLAGPQETRSLVIDSLGGQGDGVCTSALAAGKSLFVPFTLPGEEVTATFQPPAGNNREAFARLESVDQPSPHRVSPPCPLFTRCGGCSLQHVEQSYLLEWKRQQVCQSLRHRGFPADEVETMVQPAIAIEPASRRRTVLSFEYRRKGELVIGFHQRQSHILLAVEQCAVLHPALNALLPALQEALPAVVAPDTRGELTATLTESGIDLLVSLKNTDLTVGQRQDWADFAARLDLARLSLQQTGREDSELLAGCRPATLTPGGVAVSMPPGAFLQPSRQGEHVLASLVLAALPPADSLKKLKVADLFCGLGTFTLPMAVAGYRVEAFDSAPALVQSLKMASAGFSQGLRPRVEQRDLFRLPLFEQELAGFHTLVLDPPRAGGRAQCEAIAASLEFARDLQSVVMVSCQPATFARDARILQDAGLLLEKVTPVDQFCWSAHTEVVALFRRTR